MSHGTHPIATCHICSIKTALKKEGKEAQVASKTQVSFAKEPYKRDYILRKRPTLYYIFK